MGQHVTIASPAFETGLHTGRIRWEGGIPLYSHVHSSEGISTLLQSTRLAEAERMEAHVSSTRCAVLVVRAGSATAVDARLAGQPLRTTFGIGEGSFMSPGTDSWWSVERDEVGGWFHIGFSQDVLAQIDGTERGTIATIPHVADATVSTLARLFFDLTEGHETPEPMLWQSLGHALLWRVLLLGAGTPAKLPRGGLAPWQAKRTTEYLADNLERRVTLEELAAVARLSPFHFARAFARTVGMPPYRYQRKLRMERACKLLATSDLRIIDVALAVGYESPQALARVFSAALGMTPSEWRRRHAGS